MKIHQFFLLNFVALPSLAQDNTYWVHESCKDEKFKGGFDLAIKDAQFMARRALMRLNAPVSPYMDEIFLLLFRKPKSDIETLKKVKNVFQTIGERFASTTNQVTAEVRFYCDDDEYGQGKRWTLTPNDPDDPIYAKNDQLPRLAPPGEEKNENFPLQQWQDETNWIRQTRGSMGCADGETKGETFTRKLSSERTPSGSNPNRVTTTICDGPMLNSDLITPDDFAYASSFKTFDVNFVAKGTMEEFTLYCANSVSLILLHEFTHIDKDGFRTNDYAYPWKEALTLSAENAIRNAETYVFYAMFARAADKGHKLYMGEVNDATKFEKIKKGDIVYDENLERVGGEESVPF